MSGRRSMPTRSETERALCRGAIYQTVSVGFYRPSAKLVERFASAIELAALKMAAAQLAADGAAELTGAVDALGARTALELGALDAQYGRMFGHTARALVPPYETEYQLDAPFLQPQQLADIAGFYRAFGLRLGPSVRERVDHISCECEFLSFLCRKQAFALIHDDQAMLAATRSGQRQFLRDHLGRFALAFGTRVQREDCGGFYGALAGLLLSHLRSECAAAEVAVGPELLELRSAQEEPLPIACGNGCELLTAAEGEGEGERERKWE